MPVLKGAFYDPNAKPSNSANVPSAPSKNDLPAPDNRKWWQKLLGKDKNAAAEITPEDQLKAMEAPPPNWKPQIKKDRGALFLDAYKVYTTFTIVPLLQTVAHSLVWC